MLRGAYRDSISLFFVRDCCFFRYFALADKHKKCPNIAQILLHRVRALFLTSQFPFKCCYDFLGQYSHVNLPLSFLSILTDIQNTTRRAFARRKFIFTNKSIPEQFVHSPVPEYCSSAVPIPFDRLLSSSETPSILLISKIVCSTNRLASLSISIGCTRSSPDNTKSAYSPLRYSFRYRFRIRPHLPIG